MLVVTEKIVLSAPSRLRNKQAVSAIGLCAPVEIVLCCCEIVGFTRRLSVTKLIRKQDDKIGNASAPPFAIDQVQVEGVGLGGFCV